MLKKIAILLLVLLSGLVAAKVLNLPIPFLNSGSSSSKSDSKVLNHVPEDSAVYFASDVKLMHAALELSNIDTMIDSLKEEMNSGYMDENEESALNSMFEVINALAVSEKAASYGFSTEGSMVFYVDGLFPVLKMPVGDKAVLTANIEKLVSQFVVIADGDIVESEKDIAGSMLKQLVIEDEASIVYEISEEYLTLVFSVADIAQTDLDAVFNAQGVANSVLASASYKADQSKYGFNDSFKMVVNFQEIAKALVDPQSSKLGKQIAEFIPDAQAGLEMMQTAECKEDVMSFANAMPRLVSGYTDLKISEKSIESKSSIILEIMNKDVLDILKTVVGHISSNALSSDAMMNVGVGVDVSQLVPAYNALSELIQNTEYKCMPLAMGKMMVPPAPAELAMVAQAAGSVKGASVSIIDFDVDFSGMPQLKSLDVLATVSTTDAASLAIMAGANPFVTFDTLSSDGTPSVLNIPVPLGVEVKAAIKNNFLAVFSGEKGEAAANALSSESLDANSVAAFSINLGAILAKEQLFKDAMDMSGACGDKDIKEAFDLIGTNSGKELVTLEINDFGIVFSGESTLTQADTPFNVCP